MPASTAFSDLFGTAAEIDASAPGLVNLLGEHTDYHDGFVLPTVIPQRTHAAPRARGGRRVRACSAGTSTEVESYDLGSESQGRGWLDYVQGLTLTLSRRRIELPGFDMRLESAVPIGADVSSSAALEVSVLRALRTRFGLALDDVESSLRFERPPGSTRAFSWRGMFFDISTACVPRVTNFLMSSVSAT